MSENATSLDPDRTFLIATGNTGKRKEFEHLLGGLLEPDWEVYDRNNLPVDLEAVEETEESFVGNAVKKAVESAADTGLCALADDSGLCVDALDGAPGVRSARFAGPDASDEENNRRLVAELEDVADEERTARFEAVLALALPDNRVADRLLERAGLRRGEIASGVPGEPATAGRDDGRIVVWFRGRLEGRITREAAGTRGFGYDPYFKVPEYGESLAELTVDEKNEISHRAQAVDELLGFFGGGE